MKAKNYRLPGIVLALALALQSPSAQVISVKVDTGSRANPGVVNHNCRLYAAISNDLPAGLLQRQLVDDPNSLKHLAASDNIDGWGIAYYPDYRATPTIRRGAETAYTDTDYNTLVGQINTSEPKITLAHIRNCTSGCCCHGCYTIDDPHPFYRDKNGTHWTFAHNGSLDKGRLLGLIDQDYLARNPLDGSNIPACDPTHPELVVDSELYFTLLLQHIEANGWNVVNGIAEAIKALDKAGEYGSANFVMSDGSTVWAFRRGSDSYHTMYYVHGSNYTAVASQYTPDSQGDWQPIEDNELLVLTGDGSPVSIPDVRDYPSLLVYPYLGKTTPTSVVISWATDNAGASEVRYSLDQSYSSLVAATESTRDGKYWHSATITGLTANTTYHYKVYTGGYDVTPWPDITFTTASESTTSPLTFVVVGDSQPDDDNSPPSQGALNVAAEMDQHSFDLALRTGDMVYSGGICSGDNSSWNQYIRAYFDLYRQSTSHIPFYPSVGNHELNGGSCGYQGYTDVYDLPENAPSGDREEYYSFDWGNAHFVALDTNQNYAAGSTQYNWLVQDLQASTQPWKIVFFHHPAYSSGNHGSTSAVQTYLVPVFETYGVSVVFNGHDHDYERTCPIRNGGCTTPQDGGVIYYVTGGGGAYLYPASRNWFTAYSASLNQFLKVQADNCRLRLDTTDTNGNVFDSYEINRCPNQAPVVGDIPNQTIAEGQAFPTINLDDYVSDVDNTDAEITWTYSGNSALTVTIVDRVATIGIPNPDWNGSETITFTARDPAGASDSDNATFTVTPVNDPPTAVNDSYAMNEDTSLSIAAPGVLGNDSNVDSDPLTAVQVSSPAHGTLTLNSNGGFTYTPDANWNGTDNFTYKANDGALDSNVATVSITVRSVNDPPAAVNDSYTTNEDTPLSIAAPGVLGNDSGVVSVTLTAVQISGPAHGTLTLNSNGAFTYTPDANWNGTDNFTYKAYDGALDSNIATASITVRSVNDPPVAMNDSYSTNEDTPLNIAAPGVLGNDSGVVSVTLTAVQISGPAHGTLTLNSNGGFTYTPDANWNGTDNFTYTANDGALDSNVATVSITVTPVNDAPSFTKGGDQTVLEDAGSRTVYTWARNISPGPASESGQILTFTLTTNNPALFAVAPAVNPANGNLTFTPASNMNGSATVTVTLRDGGGTANGGVDTSAPQTFRITVTAVNDAPSFTKGADQTVLEDAGSQTVSTWARNISPGPANESGQILTFILTTDNPALFVVAPAVNPANGNLTFTPAPDMNGSATVTVTLKDSGGTANGGVDTSALQTFRITVTPINDAPSFTKGADQTVLEDAGAQIVSAWAKNISPGPANESGQILTFILTTDNPALFVVAPAVNPANGNLTFTPAPYMHGSATVTVTLKDSGGTANGGVDTSALQTFRITVFHVNHAPMVVNDVVTTGEDTPVHIAVLANDTDPDGDSLTISSATQPAYGTVVNEGTTVTYTPNPHWTGVDTFTYTAGDGQGGVDTAMVTITVPLVLGPPVTITIQVNPGALTANSGATAAITATVVDAKGHLLPNVTLSGNISPPTLGGVIELGATDASGRVCGMWTAGNLGGIGSLSIGNGSITVTIAITLNNPMPAITGPSPATVTVASAPFTLTITGDGFVTDSRVYWNGAVRATTFVSATQLKVAISSEDLSRTGTTSVAVFNPEPGGGMSEGVPFTVADAKLYIPIIARNSVSAPDLVEDGTALLDPNR